MEINPTYEDVYNLLDLEVKSLVRFQRAENYLYLARSAVIIAGMGYMLLLASAEEKQRFKAEQETDVSIKEQEERTMKQNEIEYYRDTKTNERYYVVSGELTAIDAILTVARVTHVGKDKLQENRAYVAGGNEEDLFFVGVEEPVLDGARLVWAIEKRKQDG